MTFAILVFSDPGGSWYSAYSIGKAARRFDSTFKAVGPRCVDDNAAAAVDDNAAAATFLPEPGPEAPADSAPAPTKKRRIMTMPKPAAESSSSLNYKKDKKGKDSSKKDN